MPWTDAQVRLFAAAAHNPSIAKSHGMTQAKAREMQMEAPAQKRKQLAKALRK